MENREKNILNLIQLNKYMQHVPSEDEFILTKKINERLEGKKFSIQEHLQCLVRSLLSNQRKWSQIEEHLDEIDKIFGYFDYNFILEKIKNEGYEYFVLELKRISCGNRNINYQMRELEYNINLLLEFQKEAGSIDNYYKRYSIEKLVKNLSDFNSKMKIRGMGEALVWEYLRGVGIDGMKPDLHIMRIFGSQRLGYSDKINATAKEVLDIAKLFSKNSNKSKSYIDILLWEYCASGKGSICNSKPRCDLCTIKEYCNKPKRDALL